MNHVASVLLPILLLILTVSSYVDRLYSEMGKFLSRDFQENIDVWEENIEPRLKLSRDQLALSASVVAQLTLVALTLVLALLLFDRNGVPAWPTPAEMAQALFAAVLAIVLCNRLLPYAFFTRTRGRWLLLFVWPLRILFWSFLPLTLLIGFLLSIVALAGERTPEQTEEDAGAAVEALLEAGQEEGILDEEDHALIRSAVEFGEKLVREVMTPRPQIFAVLDATTVEELLGKLETTPLSRIPVYSGNLDNITGIVFAHDTLQISDTAAHTTRVGEIARTATFIPETKRASEAMREMQREKQHMRIVIDEYGGVAGLVTIEDLVEEIVGTIADEHEEEEAQHAVREESEGVWSVPGSLELSEVERLMHGDWQAPEDYEATTIAGLVSEMAGRIPMRGEVVEESGGLRCEIVASTGRRIERLRISLSSASLAEERNLA